MTISIIIPVYNKTEYLKECLKSALGQTEDDLEVICVDDGSTDGSAEIVERFAGNDRRIRIIRQPNLGAGAARTETGDALPLRLASGITPALRRPGCRCRRRACGAGRCRTSIGCVVPHSFHYGLTLGLGDLPVEEIRITGRFGIPEGSETGTDVGIEGQRTLGRGVHVTPVGVFRAEVELHDSVFDRAGPFPERK